MFTNGGQLISLSVTIFERINIILYYLIACSLYYKVNVIIHANSLYLKLIAVPGSNGIVE